MLNCSRNRAEPVGALEGFVGDVGKVWNDIVHRDHANRVNRNPLVGIDRIDRGHFFADDDGTEPRDIAKLFLQRTPLLPEERRRGKHHTSEYVSARRKHGETTG